MSKISIITSFVGLWLTSYLSDNNQLFFGFFLIFTFGILHGANDLVLIHQISTQKKKTFFKILTSYLVIVLISVLLFTILPILALFFFIIVSAYHFGEQHWQTINVYEKSVLTKFFELVYGLLILSILLNFNRVEVSKIIVEITTINFPPYIYDIILAVVSLFFVVLTCVLYIKFNSFKNVILEQIFYLVLLTVIFKSSSLIWGFTIYFIFWHSIPSLYDQIVFLYGNYSFQNFKKYFKTAFWYWLVSLVGIMILYFIAKDLVIFDALFFSFLASITFPHAIVILKMYEK